MSSSPAPIRSEEPQPSAPVAKISRKWLYAAIAVAVVALGFGASWLRARIASAGVRAIAVLPFDDLSPQKDQDWFCDGITEEVIDALGRIPGMQVAARTSTFAFKNQPRDLHKVGDQLGVAAVLEGSIQKSEGRLKVEVQLTRTSDGYRLWSRTFDQPDREEFAIHREIAAAVRSRVGAGGAAPRNRHQPTPQAYEAYLEGRHLFDQAQAESIDKAAAKFEAATGLDPEFAQAWAWLAIAREYRVDDSLASPNEGMPGSRDAAERAVALDPDSGEPHLALGLVRLQYDWDWAGARTELARAVDLCPGSSIAHHWMAHWYETQGLMDSALSEMQRAFALDPLSDIILADLVSELESVHQADKALTYAQKAVDLHPDSATDRVTLMQALIVAGQKDKARELLRTMPPSPDQPSAAVVLAGAELGDKSEVAKFLDTAEDLHSDQHVPAVVIAAVAAAGGDLESAFHWLDVAYDERSVHLPYARISPVLPVSDARFTTLLQNMNLPAARP